MPKFRPDGAAHVAAIVLAAGGSSRLGAPKQLVLFRGSPLVRHAVIAAAGSGAHPVIVVLGAQSEQVAAAVRGAAGVVSVVNERWREGLASSIAAGVREAARIDPECDGVLITVADQPLVDRLALRRLLEAFGSGPRVVASAYSDTIGVPALIGREHFGELLELTGDAGAGVWLRTSGAKVHRVRLPDAAIDIDSVEDAARLAAIP